MMNEPQLLRLLKAIADLAFLPHTDEDNPPPQSAAEIARMEKLTFTLGRIAGLASAAVADNTKRVNEQK